VDIHGSIVELAIKDNVGIVFENMIESLRNKKYFLS